MECLSYIYIRECRSSPPTFLSSLFSCVDGCVRHDGAASSPLTVQGTERSPLSLSVSVFFFFLCVSVYVSTVCVLLLFGPIASGDLFVRSLKQTKRLYYPRLAKLPLSACSVRSGRLTFSFSFSLLFIITWFTSIRPVYPRPSDICSYILSNVLGRTRELPYLTRDKGPW
jgi:hypothetical protein